MNFNNNNISDDWGWYVDIESNNLVQEYFRPSNPTYKFKNFKVIKEEPDDEYHYYKKNLKDIEEIYMNKEIEENKSQEKSPDNFKVPNGILLLRVGSRTIITAIIAYFIFFVI
jgi:hypothetical protein